MTLKLLLFSSTRFRTFFKQEEQYVHQVHEKRSIGMKLKEKKRKGKKEKKRRFEKLCEKNN